MDAGLVAPNHFPHTRGWLVNKSEALKKTGHDNKNASLIQLARQRY